MCEILLVQRVLITTDPPPWGLQLRSDPPSYALGATTFTFSTFFLTSSYFLGRPSFLCMSHARIRGKYECPPCMSRVQYPSKRRDSAQRLILSLTPIALDFLHQIDIFLCCSWALASACKRRIYRSRHHLHPHYAASPMRCLRLRRRCHRTGRGPSPTNSSRNLPAG